MNALEYAQHLRQSAISLQKNVPAVLYAEMEEIKKDLEKRSPVDSEEFKQGWRILRASKSSGEIFHMRIDNKTAYGLHLDLGVGVGEAPWYFPNKSKPPSGKLATKNGRVWAGGLSPSGFVFGGIIDPVIFYNKGRKNSIARKVADTVVGVL
jgi:hypothetical protein